MPDDCFRVLHRLFRRLQQKNRFVGAVKHTGLSLVETHFLIEIEANPSISISKLSTLLSIDQSFTSRMAQKFIRSGLIEVSANTHDIRQKNLKLTTSGLAKTKQIDSAADHLISTFAARLTKAQEKHLVTLFKTLADQNSVAQGSKRSHETQYRVEQRRVTRLFGLLGTDVWSSGLSSSEWQTLAEICLAPVAPQVSELASLLGLQVHSLSAVINSLEKRGYIKRAATSQDKRASILIPEKKGISFNEKIESQAASTLKRSLEPIQNEVNDLYLPIFQLFVGEFDGQAPPLLPEYQIKEISSPQQFAEARGFAARCFVSHGKETSLPINFLPLSSRVFVISKNEDTVALVQTSKQKSSIVLELTCSVPGISDWTSIGFTSAAINLALGSTTAFDLTANLDQSVNTLISYSNT
jgi:DNA-binding MarR family transcriptional regulator